MSAERLLEKEFKGDVKIMRSSGEHVTGELKKKGVDKIYIHTLIKDEKLRSWIKFAVDALSKEVEVRSFRKDKSYGEKAAPLFTNFIKYARSKEFEVDFRFKPERVTLYSTDRGSSKLHNIYFQQIRNLGVTIEIISSHTSAHTFGEVPRIVFHL